MLILSVIVVGIVAAGYLLIPMFRSGVASLGGDVYSILAGEGIGETPGRVTDASSCPYTFDSRTGRWHDTEHDYLMVSFADASDAGCR
jgi:hypothetical protein